MMYIVKTDLEDELVEDEIVNTIEEAMDQVTELIEKGVNFNQIFILDVFGNIYNINATETKTLNQRKIKNGIEFSGIGFKFKAPTDFSVLEHPLNLLQTML